jgi:hypothetical protein
MAEATRSDNMQPIIECLEPRRLFSTSIPVLSSAYFVGPIMKPLPPYQGNIIQDIDFTITSQKRGRIKGLLELTFTDVVHFSFTGSVNRNGSFTIRAIDGHAQPPLPQHEIRTITLLGGINSDGRTISGLIRATGFYIGHAQGVFQGYPIET